MIIPAVAALALFLPPPVRAGNPASRSDRPAESGQRVALRYAPAPVDNPLKGLVPYSGTHAGKFPHSMEFNYLPLSALVVGQDRYDWAPLEKLLNEIASRRHQAVFRVYLEYPGRRGVIPKYLIDGGLKVHRYVNTNTQPFPPSEIETPDYADPNLRLCLRRFVAAMGKRYDGDPRIGFITAGLLGTWGEWHTHPRGELWASKDTQIEVLDAYEAAFRITPVLLRYPAREGHYAQAPNANRRFGYHDDSFAWATLETGKAADNWFFLPALKQAGALEKWKRYPIGGEIRPEAWGLVFDEDPAAVNPQVQDFARCVDETHASWLMDSGMFMKPQPDARVKRAMKQVRRMGYEFHVAAYTVRASGRSLQVTVEVENRGVAPFYYEWPVDVALLDGTGEPIRVTRAATKMTGILPGAPPTIWRGRIDVSGAQPGSYTLAMKAHNLMQGGIPLRFANETQDRDAPGWLSLGPIAVP